MRVLGHRLPGRTTMPIADPTGRERHVEWATAELDPRRGLLSPSPVTSPRASPPGGSRRNAIMESAFGAAAQPMAVLDAAGAIVRVNAAAARLAGSEAAALAGRTPWDAGL